MGTPQGRTLLSGRRWRLAALAVAVALCAVVASPSIGAGKLIRGLFGGPHGPATSQATALVSTPVSGSETASLWRAPSAGGGRCVFLVFAHPSKAYARPDAANGGAQCSDSPAAAAKTEALAPPLEAFVSSIRNEDGSVKMVVGGQARPSSHIARVILRSGTGETQLPFAHGYYIASLAGSTEVGKLPAAGGPFFIVGYDKEGAVVTTLDLAKLLAEQQP